MKGIFKNLTGDIAVYSISTISTRLVSFILFPFFARKFTPEDYGVIGFLTTLSFLVTALSGLGMDSAASRWFYDSEEKAYRKRAFTSWLLVQGSLLPVLTALLFGASFLVPVGKYLGDSNPRLLLLLACGNIGLGIIGQITNQFLVLTRRPMGSVFLSITSTLSATLFSILFVFVFKLGLTGFYLGQTVSAVINLLICMVWMARRIFTWRLPSLSFIKPMVKYGCSIIPANVTSYFLLFFSSSLIIHLTSRADMGYYQIGYTLASGIMLITGPFTQAFQPLSYSMINEPDSGKFYTMVLDIYVTVLSLGCLFLGLFYKDIILLLLTEKYAPSFFVAGALTFANFIYSTNCIAVIGMIKEKKVFYFGIVVALSNILVLLLVSLGAWLGGINGAASAFVVGYLITIIALFVISQRIFHIAYHLADNLGMVLAAFSFFAISAWLQYRGLPFLLPLKLLLLAAFAGLAWWRVRRLNLIPAVKAYIAATKS